MAGLAVILAHPPPDCPKIVQPGYQRVASPQVTVGYPAAATSTHCVCGADGLPFL